MDKWNGFKSAGYIHAVRNWKYWMSANYKDYIRTCSFVHSNVIRLSETISIIQPSVILFFILLLTYNPSSPLITANITWSCRHAAMIWHAHPKNCQIFTVPCSHPKHYQIFTVPTTTTTRTACAIPWSRGVSHDMTCARIPKITIYSWFLPLLLV